MIRGCVPKKLLVYGAHFAEDLKDARRFGWDVRACGFDWSVLRDNVQAEVARLEQAFTTTLASNEVDVYKQHASIDGPHSVRLAGGERISARTILIATGASPHRPDVPGQEHAITSDEVFQLGRLPERILIVGAGYIANEMAGIFNELGTVVTLANRTDVILRGYDETVRDRLLQISMAKGIAFRSHADLQRITREPDGGLTVAMTNHDPLQVDHVLFASGRIPNVDGLGLETVGVEQDPAGGVVVDADGRSSVPSIYAIGDVTNRIQLTPVAAREGQAFADTLFGDAPWRVDYDQVPSAVFSHPPIAAVGLTEERARETLGAVAVYQSDFRPMKNVLAGREERALYKMVCDADSGRVVGLHMIGPEAPEILQAAAIAVRGGLTKTDFDRTVAIHPSMAEELVLMR